MQWVHSYSGNFCGKLITSSWLVFCWAIARVLRMHRFHIFHLELEGGSIDMALHLHSVNAVFMPYRSTTLRILYMKGDAFWISLNKGNIIFHCAKRIEHLLQRFILRRSRFYLKWSNIPVYSTVILMVMWKDPTRSSRENGPAVSKSKSLWYSDSRYIDIYV